MMTVEIENDATVAEKKAEAAGRKPAPKIEVDNNFVDYRKKKIDDLNARDDGYEYKYTSRDRISDEDLDLGDAEIVKHTDGPRKGRMMRDGNDPIIRRRKDESDARRKSLADFSETQVRSVSKNEKTIVHRQKKNPTKN
jgi:hypothetical protein